MYVEFVYVNLFCIGIKWPVWYAADRDLSWSCVVKVMIGLGYRHQAFLESHCVTQDLTLRAKELNLFFKHNLKSAPPSK